MIQFVFDNAIHTVEQIAPSTSLLDYLRLELVQTGTKEGCAAGDCGACTVALGELDDSGSLKYSSINACITPLGSIHGKHVLTVEGLGSQPKAAGRAKESTLHPVQKAMVEYHGSQCGFCTPGFIMSLFTWWSGVKSGQHPADRHNLETALSGNLCRCTGYQPILRAAAHSLNIEPPPNTGPNLEKIAALLTTIDLDKPASLDHENGYFLAPKNSGELVNYLKLYPDARLVAGATDLGLEITQQLKTINTLIYTRSVKELCQIKDSEHSLTLGAAVTYTQAQKYLHKYFPNFAELLDRLGSLQIRNQGTFGGNIANASPIGDTPPVFLALNAQLNIIGPEGSRSIAINDFFTGYRKTLLKDGEVIESVEIPKLKQNEHLQVYKVSRRFDDDISAVCMAAWLKLDKPARPSNNSSDLPVVLDTRIAFGGMAATPARASHSEKSLINQAYSIEAAHAAKMAILKDFQPIDDVRASAQYRLHIAGNLLVRCQQELLGQSEPPPWAHNTDNTPQEILHPSDALQWQSPLFIDAAANTHVRSSDGDKDHA